MRAIANPIHEFQGVKVERTFGKVVLDENKALGDARGFGEKFTDVVGVVEYVHKHTDVECCVRKRDVKAIKGTTGDAAGRALRDLDTLDLNRGDSRLNQAGDGAVTAADIEDRGVRWDHGRKEFGQNADTASKHKGPMRPRDPREDPGIARRIHYAQFGQS